MKMSIREAINLTLHEEMARDSRVVVMGEDVASGQGGVYGVTAGLTEKFGVARVIDTPITESAIVGAAGGAALTGLRPVDVPKHLHQSSGNPLFSPIHSDLSGGRLA